MNQSNSNMHSNFSSEGEIQVKACVNPTAVKYQIETLIFEKSEQNPSNENILAAPIMPQEKSLEYWSSMQDQLDLIDANTICFFKLGLFKNVAPEYPALHDIFTQYVYKTIRNEKNYYFFRFYMVFSYHFFQQHFIKLINQDVKRFRNAWLISHCDVHELYGLDAKSSHHYFQSLESKKTLEYIKNFNSLENWIHEEYKKARLQLFFSALQNNSNFIIFWCVVLFVFIFCVTFSTSDNSFTIMQQIKVWLSFVFGLHT